jgi:hypothetical protein
VTILKHRRDYRDSYIKKKNYRYESRSNYVDAAFDGRVLTRDRFFRITKNKKIYKNIIRRRR